MADASGLQSYNADAVGSAFGRADFPQRPTKLRVKTEVESHQAAVAEAASEAGLEVHGYASQAAFLLALGIESDIAAADDNRTRYALAGQARRLLMPTEMGETFKVIALTRGLDAPLAGFTLQDLQRQL